MNRTMRINRLSDKVEVLQCTEWMGDCNISHFITTRQGGVSIGAYAQMNPGLYTDDCPDSIRKNREILAEGIQLPVQNIITPHQTHQALASRESNRPDAADLHSKPSQARTG